MTMAELLSYGRPPFEPVKAEAKPKLFAECCRFICPGFTINEQNRALLNSVYLYMEGWQGKYDPRKGLWLWGSIGTGKSTIIRIMNYYSKFSQGLDIGNYPIGGFRIESATGIVNNFVLKGQDALNLYTYNNGTPRTMAFDELGREPCPAKYFGTEVNVMQYIFQCRYEFRNECLTHVTTNFSPKEIQRMYGSYIADRINEMFNVIEMTGQSRR